MIINQLIRVPEQRYADSLVESLCKARMYLRAQRKIKRESTPAKDFIPSYLQVEKMVQP